MTMVREGLLGPSYLYHRRLIEQSKSWSPSEIREYQEARLQLLIRRYGDEVTMKVDYCRDPLLVHPLGCAAAHAYGPDGRDIRAASSWGPARMAVPRVLACIMPAVRPST